ncbi:PIN domain-containing protein [Priestia aryabhattai]|uniref:PIN domain-containing protein n=1 Tax=Priestia aryabhattai TaxID=412384 RepID=UPI003D2A8E7B
MNIFLDTNVFFGDPFLTRGQKPLLLRLAKHEDVKLFINDTVYKEVLRKHKEFVEQKVKVIEESFGKISSLLRPERDTFDFTIEPEDLLEDVVHHFGNLEAEEQLHIIPYDADVLTDIVEVDMYEKQPFFRYIPVTNHKGEVINFKKKEVRDSIIWYTYQRYIEKNGLEDCYFISHNTKDFGAQGKRKIPKGQPYALHEELAESSNLVAYKEISDFLTHKAAEIKELFKDTQLHERILSEEFADQVEEELKNGLAEELVKTHLTHAITQFTEGYLSDTTPEDIHPDYFMGGYVEANCFGQIDNIKLVEVEVFGGDISVAVSLEVETEVDINLYNPVHDDRHDRHQYYSTDRILVEESVVFLLPLNEEKALDEPNFSLRDYVKDVQPGDVDIEVLQRQTIEHVPMFEEDYDEDYIG